MSIKHQKDHSANILKDSSQIHLSTRAAAIAIVITVLLGGSFFVLGKYFEFNSPGAFDSGAYVYSAAHILNGAEIGVEEKPSAQLGTLLVNLLGVWLTGYNEVGVKSIQMVLQAAALILMFIATRRLFGNMAAAVSTIVASFCLSSPLIAKYGNVKEQYMIAFMVMSMSCFVLYQLNNRWFYAILAGAFASFAPLFKPTGTTVIGAIALFVLIQPFLKNRSFKQTGIDILLLLTGAVVAMGPLYIWIIFWNVKLSLPYSFVWTTISNLLPSGSQAEAGKAVGNYVTETRELVPFARQWPTVLRYYQVLILPIALAFSSIIARLVKLLLNRRAVQDTSKEPYDRFVLLFGIWWILDMSFVWISAASYEQYYLPLTASGAMLGGYIAALYADKLAASTEKAKWINIGIAGLFIMAAMGWNIFFGIRVSPHSGQAYGDKQRGYLQKLNEVSYRHQNDGKMAWEVLGQYIRDNSEPNDKIYVWGWWPGIYVQAQRFSSASTAFAMPRPAPEVLEQVVSTLIEEFQKEPPKFIVDSRKRHIPTERPPYELWPIIPKGFMGIQKESFLPNNKEVIERFDHEWTELLRKHFGEDEARRYEVLKPLRQFVMTNYRIVSMFGQHVLFELKSPQSGSEQQ